MHTKIKGGVTVAPRSRTSGIVVVSYVTAFGLAAVSGRFSITGMTAIFVGAFWPIIGMGIALEIGKLTAVASLGHHSGMVAWPLRAALGVLVAVVMGLNGIGAYGLLSNAHVPHQVEAETAIGSRLAGIQRRISVQEGTLGSLPRQITQIDKSAATTLSHGQPAYLSPVWRMWA